jgi:hypothetical protein
MVLTLALAGCGGSSGPAAPAATTYTIGGTVVGLESNATLDIGDGSQSLSVTKNGAFTLPTAVVSGAAYTIAFPSSPSGQTCGQLNGAGSVDAADVTNILVYCTYNVSAETLDGTYEIATFDITSDTDQLFSGVPFNGSGTQGASAVVTNQAGTITTSTGSGAAYTVTTADALPVLTVAANNVGGIAGADGDEFYWLENAVNPGSGPGLALGVKPLQTATIGSLAGSWITVTLTQAATPFVSEGPVTINADGSFSGTQATLDVTGVANSQAVNGGAGSYTVINNVVSIGADSGYISANGEFAMLTAVGPPGVLSANSPGLTAAVQQGTGVTLATLNGVYSIGTLAFETASTGDGETFTLYFDGVGDFSGTGTENDSGTSGTISFGGTYTVTSSGVLTLTDSSGNAYSGGVSADGNIVVAATLTSGGTESPRMFVGFRQ